jgi:hypothetical protein
MRGPRSSAASKPDKLCRQAARVSAGRPGTTRSSIRALESGRWRGRRVFQWPRYRSTQARCGRCTVRRSGRAWSLPWPEAMYRRRWREAGRPSPHSWWRRPTCSADFRRSRSYTSPGRHCSLTWTMRVSNTAHPFGVRRERADSGTEATSAVAACEGAGQERILSTREIIGPVARTTAPFVGVVGVLQALQTRSQALSAVLSPAFAPDLRRG